MSSACCVSGEIHQGTPTGQETKVHGLDCYVVEPPVGIEKKGVVVILPDVFGWRLSNTRILADNYAKKGGFLVLLPEFMNGKSLLKSGASTPPKHSHRILRYLNCHLVFVIQPFI